MNNVYRINLIWKYNAEENDLKWNKTQGRTRSTMQYIDYSLRESYHGTTGEKSAHMGTNYKETDLNALKI